MKPAVPRCGLVLLGALLLLLLLAAAWCPAASAAEMVMEKDYWLTGRASWCVCVCVWVGGVSHRMQALGLGRAPVSATHVQRR
jgi:hypothetical protein